MVNRNIPITTLVAYDNPRGGQAILDKFGVSRARNHKDLARKLDATLIRHKAEAAKELAMAHPDRGLILATEQVEEELSGACGCSGADGKSCKCGKVSPSSNAEGDKPAAPKASMMDSISPHLPLIIGGTLLLVAVVVIMKNA